MKASNGNLLEVEVGATRNCNLLFPATGRRIRGKFDPVRASRTDGQASSIVNDFPDPIPGQILGIDLESGTGYIRDTLHDDKHSVLRRRLEKKFSLPAAREEFPNVHVPSWLFWLRRAVECGACVVIAGKLPDKADGEPEFRTPLARASQARKSPTARLTEAIEKQTAMFERVLLKLAEKK